MKLLSEKQGIARLRRSVDRFRRFVRAEFEHRAHDCTVCPTQGACCRDEHFVNVHISHLEATAIVRDIAEKAPELRKRVADRTQKAIALFGDVRGTIDFEQTFACPLFEPGVGCLVHSGVKPAACIVHACYDSRSDLPPNELLEFQEKELDDLSRRVYGRSEAWLPIPLALQRAGSGSCGPSDTTPEDRHRREHHDK